MPKTKESKKEVATITSDFTAVKRPVGRPKTRVLTPVKNINDLRINLMQLYNDVQAGNVDHSTAKVIGNISGKIISCVNAEIKLRRFNNERSLIEL